ncbi:MAG TPA: thiolase family protein [Ilumatobacter sp.]|nr:thiolase family protein [Ilumatobacter sp.]
MPAAVIVDAVRTPIARRDGALRHWHPVDLAAETLLALARRTGIDPATIDDVVMGCVMQVGEQAVNVARNAVLAAGWPDSVPGTTIDRQCGSGQQAIHFAAQGVIAGTYDAVIAGGVEAMTRVPMGSSMADGRFGYPFGPRIASRYASAGGLVPQGVAAELIADRWQIDRDEMDQFALESHRRAAQAVAEGRFDLEIIGISTTGGASLTLDEGVRETSPEALGRLRPVFRLEADGGRVTAGNSSQISDGAAAVIITSEEFAAKHGLRPRARVVDFAVVGSDPRLMLTGTIPATHRVLARAGLALGDMDVIECNEAFASVVLAWERECHPDMSRVNVNGGAIALGHPLGCSGVRLLVTLMSELERSGGRYGLQVMAEGGGMANALVIERCD